MDKGAVEEALRRLHNAGIPAFTVGETASADEGRWLKRGEKRIPLPVFHQDDLSKIFG
jgi:hypothetical protein